MHGSSSEREAGSGFAVALTIAVLLAVPHPSGAVPSPSAQDSPNSSVAIAAGEPVLTLDPPAWWMGVDNSTGFEAAWVSVPPGCMVDPAWYLWTDESATLLGSLAGSGGPSENFTATANASGLNEIEVRSAGEFDCGSNRTAYLESASANVTVVAPLALENLSAGPGPAAPATLVNLTGTITGGLAPYHLNIVWGDGTRSSMSQGQDGSFELAHSYSAGTYRPTVSVEDELGESFTGSANEPLEVSDRAATGIVSPAAAFEVGRPVSFLARFAGTDHAEPPFGLCDGTGPTESDPVPSGFEFVCTFSAPGVGSVVAGLGSPNSPVSADTISEPVQPTLSVSLDPGSPAGEVGAPLPLPIDLTGGVAPFVLQIGILGNATVTSSEVLGDGGALASVVPTRPGTLVALVDVTDADGATASASTTVEIEPPLRVNVTSSLPGSGPPSSMDLSTVVMDGVAPYFWSLDSPAIADANASYSGVATPESPFDWAGLVDPESTSSLVETVWDSVGVAVTERVPISAVAVLSGNLSILGETPGVLELTADLSGGVPPFDLWANASDGESWTTTMNGDGQSRWTLPVRATGGLNVSLVAVDQFGHAVRSHATVFVHQWAATVLPSGAGTATLLVAGAAASGTVWFVWKRHRRSRTSPSASPDPVVVLRRILEPADGADRTTVELLAEEAGVPLPVVRAAIERLVESGSIRREIVPEGEEVLAWSSHADP